MTASANAGQRPRGRGELPLSAHPVGTRCRDGAHCGRWERAQRRPVLSRVLLVRALCSEWNPTRGAALRARRSFGLIPSSARRHPAKRSTTGFMRAYVLLPSDSPVAVNLRLVVRRSACVLAGGALRGIRWLWLRVAAANWHWSDAQHRPRAQSGIFRAGRGPHEVAVLGLLRSEGSASEGVRTAKSPR